MRRFFTSESVTEGHPDKLCDYISDSVLDAYLEKDENSRVALETIASKGEIYLTGEITSKANIDIESIVRNAIKDAGGTMPEELPVPEKSLKQLAKEKNEQKKIKN